jgi:hypothetical protein
MHGRMHQHRRGRGRDPPPHRGVASRRRALIDAPHHPRGRPRGLLRHPLNHQTAQGCKAGPGFAASQDLAPLDLPGRPLLPGTPAGIRVLDTPLAPRGGLHTRRTAETGLPARCFVGTDAGVVGAPGFSLPHARVHGEHRPGLGGTWRVTRQDPLGIPPWCARLRVASPPDRAAAAGLRPRGTGPVGHVRPRLATPRDLRLVDHLTRDRWDHRVVPRGTNEAWSLGQGDRCVWSRHGPSVAARAAPRWEAGAPARRPSCWSQAGGRARGGPGWHAALGDGRRAAGARAHGLVPRNRGERGDGSAVRDRAWPASWHKNRLRVHPMSSHSVPQRPGRKTLQ